jgi:hypothetical protein
MSKKVLAIFYTQSGQLQDIIDNFTAPFMDAGIPVEKVMISPKKKFPFPWNSERFFDAMPESVLAIPGELESFQLRETAYDLVIFAYQPWFLSPSIPATSVLKHPSLIAVLKNTPVITLIGSRNMWLSAQERVKQLLKEAGAKLVGNIVLADQHNNFVSAVTMLHWMFGGKKDRYLNIFPKPGVSDAAIAQTGTFGAMALQRLQTGDWSSLQTELVHQKAVVVKSDLMFVESRASRLFSIWANMIIKKKNRKMWLVVFKYYLLIALFIVAPVVLLINNILFKPFLTGSINKKKQYYLALN